MVSSDRLSMNNDDEDNEEVPSSLPQPPLPTRPPLPPPQICSTVASCSLAKSANPATTGAPLYSLHESPQRTARASGIASSVGMKTLVGAKAAGAKSSSGTTTSTSAGTGTGTFSSVKRKKGLAAHKLEQSQKRACAMVEERQVSVEESEESEVSTVVEESQVSTVEMEVVLQGRVEEEEEEAGTDDYLIARKGFYTLYARFC